MTTTNYAPGKTNRISVSFTSAGDPADPTTVTFSVWRWRDEDSSMETYTYAEGDGPIKRTGIGQYYVDFMWPTHGRWFWKWRGTGAVEDTVESGVRVPESALPA